MKTPLLSLLLALLGGLAQPLFAQDDAALVRETLQNYLDGGTYGDTLKMAKVFHPSASMKFVDSKTGEFRDVPIAQYLAGGKANAGRKLDRTTRIASFGIEGTAAQARVESEYATYRFVDFFNLLKIGSEWRVVSKIFYREEKAGGASSRSK